MANAIKWSALGGVQVGVTGTNIKNLADGSNKLGSEYDNSTSGNRNMYADFVLRAEFATAPSTNGFVALYLLGAPDGSNYEFGADGIDPAATAWVGNFVVRQTTANHYCVLKHILLPATAFKPLVMNEGGERIVNTAASVRLTFYPYNTEVQ